MSTEKPERRYRAKDVCTSCWYDSCGSCRGGTCACQRYNHPPYPSARVRAALAEAYDRSAPPMGWPGPPKVTQA